MKWVCWVPGDGYTRIDATDIEADDAETAAELLAEQWYEGGDHFADIDVEVAAWGSGTSSSAIYRVTVDFSPSFSARRA